MGTNTLATKSNTTIVADDFNQFKTALGVDLVPRNINGVPTNEGGSLGTLDYKWLNVRGKYFYVNGELLVPDRVTARPHRIESGAAAADSAPAFLSAAGHGAGATATLAATTTHFNATINGTAIEITANASFTSLATAPSSNNTCAVNDAALTGGAETKTRGELDGKQITIDTTGSEITALDGQIAAFKIGTEVFLATVDTTNNRLLPIFRGWAGTSRGTLADDAVITLLKLSTLLLKSDGATKVSSVYYPQSVAVVPAAGTAGKVYLERSTGKHYYDDGATCSASYMVIGYAVCDSADCEYVQAEDFDKFWEDEIAVDFVIDDTTSIKVRKGSRVSVCGSAIEFWNEEHVTQASDFDSGESIAASTIFYLYATSTGAVVYSSIAPRRFDNMKRGCYHPSKYYRCIGAVRSNASNEWHYKRQERPRVDKICDSLTPVGTVVAFIGGYFGDASNGSHTTTVGNTAANVNAALPENWRVCDGAAINDPESSIYMGATRYLPQLTDDRFLMGDTVSGTAGAAAFSGTAASHTHIISHDHAWAATSISSTGSMYSNNHEDVSEAHGGHDTLGGQTGSFGAGAGVAFSIDNGTTTWYTSGVLSPSSGTGATAASGTASADGVSGSTCVPKFLSTIYIKRVK